MSVKDLKLVMAGFTLIYLVSNVSAWNSVVLSTHDKITKKAYKSVDKGRYPDLDRAYDLIKAGSSSEKGHEGIHNGGGRLKDWWYGADRKTLLGGVIPNYLRFDFIQAYTNIGRMVHLTQDQAVPAHATHINHSIVHKLPSDGMERYAGYRAEFDDVPVIDSSKMPYEYYQYLQDDTRSRLSSWINPATGVPYWSEADYAPERGRDVAFGPLGRYGSGKDSYSRWQEVETDDGSEQPSDREVFSPSPEITRDRLAIAAGYTRAMIEAASKRLPPLVSGVSLSANVLAPGRKMEIRFTALENRTKKVNYDITVARNGVRPETILAGSMELNNPQASLAVEPGREQEREILFSRRVILPWDGLISGRAAEEGSYILQVSLTDEDGNTIPDEVNTDSIRENDTKAVFSVIDIAAGKSFTVSF